MLIKDTFFPTNIYAKDVQLDNNLLTQQIMNWSKVDEGVKKTNMNGWHSPTTMHQKEEYTPLIKELYNMMHEVWKEEWLDRKPFLGNMWANINPPGSMNRAHIHPNSLWSGVYYIKAPQNSGQLKIEDPRSVALMSRPRQKDVPKPERLWREHSYDPKAGRLIMFPSWLNHCVDPNNSNDIRISVSFNFMQKCFMV